MSYIFYHPITGKFTETEQMLVWAKTHCPSYITNDAVAKENGWFYRFYFGEKKDYAWFVLRWS